MKLVKNRIKTGDFRTVRPLNTRSYAARKKADPAMQFYGTAAWQKLRANVVAERGHRCEDCGATPERLFVDHVQELKDGGAPLEPTNLRIRCGSCHTKKTYAARTERAGQIFDDE